MRFLVVTVSMGAALTLIAASGLMNWVFMTSLGKSAFEQQILGAVSIAVSAFIALLPTLLVWAWRERRPLYLILGMPVFLAFAAFSLLSAVGFAAKNRGSIGEDRVLAAAQLEDVRREIAEAARASEGERLAGRIAGLKQEQRHLEEGGAGREADNQAAVLATFFGCWTEQVERAMTLFLAVLVEIGAALGLYFATGNMRSGAESPAARGKVMNAPRETKPIGQLGA